MRKSKTLTHLPSASADQQVPGYGESGDHEAIYHIGSHARKYEVVGDWRDELIITAFTASTFDC